jgi:hypothetical protein
MPKANLEDQVKNEMLISVLEGQEILKRIQLCKEDLFRGLPIDESDLDVHLENLIKFIETTFKAKQPPTEIPPAIF